MGVLKLLKKVEHQVVWLVGQGKGNPDKWGGTGFVDLMCSNYRTFSYADSIYNQTEARSNTDMLNYWVYTKKAQVVFMRNSSSNYATSSLVKPNEKKSWRLKKIIRLELLV